MVKMSQGVSQRCRTGRRLYGAQRYSQCMRADIGTDRQL